MDLLLLCGLLIGIGMLLGIGALLVFFTACYIIEGIFY